MAVDVLSDMITASRLEEQDLATEREVILEELAMAEDDPYDVGYETFLADVLGPHTPIGRPVGGRPETVRTLDIDQVRAHWREHYRPDNLLVTAVGDIDHEQLAELVQAGLRRGGWTLEDGVLPSRRVRAQHECAPSASGGSGPMEAVSISPHRLARPSEQNHIYLGLGSPRQRRAHTLSVLMSILGEGMSSQLFQNVPAARLAYSSTPSAAYRDAGLFELRRLPSSAPPRWSS